MAGVKKSSSVFHSLDFFPISKHSNCVKKNICISGIKRLTPACDFFFTRSVHQSKSSLFFYRMKINSQADLVAIFVELNIFNRFLLFYPLLFHFDTWLYLLDWSTPMMIPFWDFSHFNCRPEIDVSVQKIWIGNNASNVYSEFVLLICRFLRRWKREKYWFPDILFMLVGCWWGFVKLPIDWRNEIWQIIRLILGLNNNYRIKSI